MEKALEKLFGFTSEFLAEMKARDEMLDKLRQEMAACNRKDGR